MSPLPSIYVHVDEARELIERFESAKDVELLAAAILALCEAFNHAESYIEELQP